MSHSVTGILFYVNYVISFNLSQEHFESPAKTALWGNLSCLDME